MKQEAKKLCLKVSWVTIFGNIFLSIFKLVAGIFGHSQAMLSDAVHSLSDVFSTFIVIIGVQLAAGKEDQKHPYGHERFENAASSLLAVLLFLVGIGIGYQSIMSIFHLDQLKTPEFIGVIAAILSILIKEIMYHYTKFYAKKINSTLLLADAWHHRSDALSSIGSLLGILGSRLGIPILDPLASIIIALFIIKISIQIYRDSLSGLLDVSIDTKTIEKMKEQVLTIDQVLSLDDMKTRLFGTRIYVDIEIGVEETLNIRKTHEIAHLVHDTIEKNFPEVKHCMVHVNPKEEKN